MKSIVLAGGCFWGLEEYMRRQNGILETKVGYANGNTEMPTYQDVCSGLTGFAEACYVKYDEKELSLSKLLEKFWKVIDPTLRNRQGNDIGTQYRTGIYYMEKEDLEEINKSVKEISLRYPEEIVTEIEELKNFYPAEEYHQRYLQKNPRGYCHINLNA